MDLDLLRTFLEVSKTKHFGKAAENLFITQSAVSARIRSLEDDLNTRLFERSTKQVNLTEEGEKFAQHAEAILLAWTNARLDISSNKEKRDLLTVGSTPDLWAYILNTKLASVTGEHTLLLNTISQSAEGLARLLFNGAIDVAIMNESMSESISTSLIQHTLLGNLNLGLFVHKNNVEIMQAERIPYIHVTWGDTFNQFVAKSFGDKFSSIMQTDNAQTAQYLLKSMPVVAYLPEKIAEQQNDLILIDKKRASVFKHKIYACFHADSINKYDIKKLIKDLYI